MSDDGLRSLAQSVLRGNSAAAGGLRWTKPSPTQYPHQWNWDSGFAAIGWSCFDWERGCDEIESLLEGRWRDGMVPHVRYDPEQLAGYFPGPDWWPGAAARVLRPGQLTSGISNPPVAVLAARVLAARAPDAGAGRAFLERVFPALREFVLWFRRSRTLPSSPLPVMVHPWESGWDNSPRWDFLAQAGLRPSRPYQRLDTVHVAAAERPTGKDYDSFLALAELLDGCGYDIGRYREVSPFCVHDVVLDALWYRAARDLVEMAREVGAPEPLSPAELTEYAAAFESTHWDGAAGAYVDLDLVSGRRLPANTAAGVAALAGGLAAPDRARRAWAVFEAAAAGLQAVPTALPGPWFEPGRYWRGPVWVNVNWLVAEGLAEAGLEEPAAALRRATLGMVSGSGTREYFHAENGGGLGTERFSWTAALALDLLQRRGKPVG